MFLKEHTVIINCRFHFAMHGTSGMVRYVLLSIHTRTGHGPSCLRCLFAHWLGSPVRAHGYDCLYRTVSKHFYPCAHGAVTRKE